MEFSFPIKKMEHQGRQIDTSNSNFNVCMHATQAPGQATA
jgi:hypothetical protein